MKTQEFIGNKANIISRRDFLRKSAVAGVAAVSLSSKLQVAAMANSIPKKIRIGVVGGSFGCGFQWHLHPDCVVEAVSDLRQDRLANLVNTYKCSKTYPSLEELVLDKNIDAVAVFTEGPNHVKHTIECMKHGKHVISAVPAAWGTIEEAMLLRETVEKYGLTYMMAETGYYQQETISARKFYQEGKFGHLFYCEAEYQHPGLDVLYIENGKRTWRYGIAPMHYPTHSTSQLVGVTKERLVEVVCHGWGDDSQYLKDNVYNNPFWNESAMFKTDKGNAFRCNVWWKGSFRGCERAQWIGDKMSFYMPTANGMGTIRVQEGKEVEKDSGGFERAAQEFELYQQPLWYKTEMLPESLRIDTGHGGSHAFLTHEFIDALVHNRKPVVDVKEALAFTVPGIIAHQSALRGGELMKIPQI